MDMMVSLAMGKRPCLFQALTGLYCPGCGGTRAVKALLAGDLWASFCYHPLVLYIALVAVRFAVSYLLFGKTRDPKYRISLTDPYVFVGCAIIAVNFLVKNYFLIVEGIDLLALIS